MTIKMPNYNYNTIKPKIQHELQKYLFVMNGIAFSICIILYLICKFILPKTFPVSAEFITMSLMILYVILVFPLGCIEAWEMQKTIRNYYNDANEIKTIFDTTPKDIFVEKAKDTIRLSLKNSSHIETKEYHFGKLTDEIYQNDCLDFSVLDTEINNVIHTIVKPNRKKKGI